MTEATGLSANPTPAKALMALAPERVSETLPRGWGPDWEAGAVGGLEAASGSRVTSTCVSVPLTVWPSGPVT